MLNKIIFLLRSKLQLEMNANEILGLSFKENLIDLNECETSFVIFRNFAKFPINKDFFTETIIFFE